MLTIAFCSCSGSSGGNDPNINLAPPTFDKFKDEAELNYYLKWVKSEKDNNPSGTTSCSGDCSSDSTETTSPTAMEPAQVETNNQSENVDEGDIIKFAGDRLVILRDQHLLVLDISGERKNNPLMLTDKELDDDFGHENWGKGAWYDEMLVYDSQIVLLAYRFHAQLVDAPADSWSSHTGAIEILRFNLSSDGSLDQGKRIFVESNDYYSGATNYATRKIGNKLIVYSPFYAARYIEDGTSYRMQPQLPNVLELVDASQKLFRRVRNAIDPTNIYQGSLASAGYMLHTFYTFDVAGDIDAFKANGVMGDYSRIYYANDDHLYLSIPKWWRSDPQMDASRDSSILYQFAISDDASLANIAEIDGKIPERFAMDEMDGVLRLITLEYLTERASFAVNAIAMDSESLGNMHAASIPTESYHLASTRFNGEHAMTFPYDYQDIGFPLLVSFRGTVPVIEKTEIASSNIWMIQPYGDNKWVTLGRDVKHSDDEIGTTIGVHIYEVDSEGKLTLNASTSLDTSWAWSEAFYNDHAFFIDSGNELIGFPYSMWEDNRSQWEDGIVYYSLSGDQLAKMGEGIVQTGEFCHECWYGNSRAVMRDGAYYNLLGRQLKVSAIDTSSRIMSEVSSISLLLPERVGVYAW